MESKVQRDRNPAQFLSRRIGFLNSRLTVAHGIWLEEEEIDLLKEFDVKVVHNPACKMKIADGPAQVKKMIQKGFSVGLGVRKNEFVSIVGPTGCGKSTLLEIMGGLRPATSGAVYVKGELADKPLPAIGMVFQEESVFPWRTTMTNVEFGLEMRGENKQERRRRCQEAIELVGLSGFEQKYPSELSGGMRQRASIARTLVMNPEIMLMDEPFGALDEQTRMILGEELLPIWGEIGQTIVFITHSINEAVQLSDRVVVMTARPGRIKATFDIDLGRPRDSSIVGRSASIISRE